MSRKPAPTAARRKDRLVEAIAPVVSPIAEAAFHQAKTAATALTNTFAGETFTTPAATYVRVNDAHFRIEASQPQSHTASLSLIGQSTAWRYGAGR